MYIWQADSVNPLGSVPAEATQCFKGICFLIFPYRLLLPKVIGNLVPTTLDLAAL